MGRIIQIALPPNQADNLNLIKDLLVTNHGISTHDYIKIIKKSIDARNRKIKINLSVSVSKKPFSVISTEHTFNNVDDKKSALIVGAGPAGLFAALELLQLGIKPIIIEQGKTVRERRKDLAAINKQKIINPTSNYCFGEGGAGTYSDGKLYTRSTKRGSICKVLELFVQHGANESILVEAHPHIGTNKLPKIIENIRGTILKYGGEIHFETQLVDFILNDDKNLVKELIVRDLKINQTKTFQTNAIILATGHSSRSVFELLYNKNILIEAQSFALGVRIEHPQHQIDAIQYHCKANEVDVVREHLPAAAYSLVTQVNGRGVYSFCMCPGGIIAPCATTQEQIVTNGWSPSKRNNQYANSGIVVHTNAEDWKNFADSGPLAALRYQQSVEKIVWQAGGATQVAPAQRAIDFIAKKLSSDLPSCSYLPGIKSVALHEILPINIVYGLTEGLKEFGRKMPGYLSTDALLVAVESRTSSPVRIPRDAESLAHLELKNLFPCGEGAGYAGGIISAAIDGQRCGNAVDFFLNITRVDG